jgi:hypothetical protein
MLTRDGHFASPINNRQAVRETDGRIDAKATTANIEGVFAGNGDSFGRMGSFPSSNSGDQNPQRRSQRVIVKVSVMVLAEGADKKSISEETRFENRRRDRLSGRLCQPSSSREETDRRRLYGALPSILAHLLSSH